MSEGQSDAKRAYWASLTPEEKARRGRNSAGLKLYYANLSPEVQAARNVQRAVSLSAALGGLSVEERQARMVKSCRSPEAITKAGAHSAFKRLEVQERIAEERRKRFATFTREDWFEWVSRSMHSPKGLQSRQEHWNRESFEDRERRLGNSFHSNEATLKGRHSSSKGPTAPEYFLGFKLEAYYPGMWAYNGGGEQKVIVAKKIPDFVDLLGLGAIIEVFGEFSHSSVYHPERLSAEDLTTLYADNGYHCLVIPGGECFDLRVMGKIKQWLASEGLIEEVSTSD